MNEADLLAVFDRATDRIARPDLAGGALARAHLQRTRRRALAVGGAALALSVLVAGVQLMGRGVDQDPAPAPSPSGPRGGQVTPEMVQPALVAPLDLPQEHSLNLPIDLSPNIQRLNGSGGSVVAAVQTSDGSVHMVQWRGRWQRVSKATGTLFRHSLAIDGGAIALRGQAQFSIYSMYSDRALSYPTDLPGASGLWLADGVGFAYDVPGPGAEIREHEPPFGTSAVAFPAGNDLDAIDIAGDGALYEFVDGDYVHWTNFQDRGARLDMSHLGELRSPAAGYGGEDLLAVVRSGLESGAAVDADGVLVVDAEGLPSSLLPIEGVPMEEVQVHLWVDQTRLLIEVGDHLVLWDTRTDERTHVSTIPAGATVAISDGDGSLVKR